MRDEIVRLFSLLNDRGTEIRRGMQAAEWEQLRADLQALVPEFAAEDDPRALRRALSRLRRAYLQYPAVRGMLPAAGGLALTPPQPAQVDEPVSGLRAAPLAQSLQTVLERMDALAGDQPNPPAPPAPGEAPEPPAQAAA